MGEIRADFQGIVEREVIIQAEELLDGLGPVIQAREFTTPPENSFYHYRREAWVTGELAASLDTYYPFGDLSILVNKERLTASWWLRDGNATIREYKTGFEDQVSIKEAEIEERELAKFLLSLRKCEYENLPK